MEILTILLRILHIFAGVAWVGGVWMLVLFVEPTVRALGPDGGKFMNYLVTMRRYPLYATVAAATTLLAGLVLFGLKWGPVWSTPKGLTFLVGGVFGLIAGGVGGMVGATTGRLTALGGEIAQQGGPPTAQQLSDLRALQERLRSLSLVTAILTSIALLAMAAARYV
jgi:hypothetical protein